MRPLVLACIFSCESKPNLRCVKPDLLSGETDNLPPGGSVFSVSGLPSSSGWAFPKQKNTRIPGAGRSGTKGKESKFKVMEDALTLILIIVLCLVLRPLISAILRGLGSSEHRRDR